MFILRDYHLFTYTFSYEYEVVTSDVYGDTIRTGHWSKANGEWRAVAKSKGIADILFLDAHRYGYSSCTVLTVREDKINEINVSYTS